MLLGLVYKSLCLLQICQLSYDPKASISLSPTQFLFPELMAKQKVLNSEEEKVLYAFGQLSARSLKPFHFDAKQVDLVLKGIRDGLLDNPELVDMTVYTGRVQPWISSRQKVVDRINKETIVAQKKLGAEFLAKNLKRKEVKKHSSGLAYEVLKPGSGKSPSPKDKVRVHYKGILINGEVFDSTLATNDPQEFVLDKVIPCWREGLQQIKEGGKIKLICPSETAFRNQTKRAKVKPGSTVVFEMDLLSVVESPQ